MDNDSKQLQLLTTQIVNIIAEISNTNAKINVKPQQHLFSDNTFFNHCISKNPCNYEIVEYSKDEPCTLGMELIHKLDSYWTQNTQLATNLNVVKQEQRYHALASIIGISKVDNFLRKYAIILPEDTIRSPNTPKIKL